VIIGLLMIAEENDVLERTLDHNAKLVDCFFVLDGTVPNHHSQAICQHHPKCAGYATDADLPRPPYGEKPVDGWRQFIFEWATARHGFGHWFLLLHGDEMWTAKREHISGGVDGLMFELPFYFPRVGDVWRDDVHPIDQLTWHLSPGWPELRAFRADEGVAFNTAQHFNVQPAGLQRVGWCPYPIKHYPYRSPRVQRARAARHMRTQFDPDNYRHILNDDNVFWTDEMIAVWRRRSPFRELAQA